LSAWRTGVKVGVHVLERQGPLATHRGRRGGDKNHAARCGFSVLQITFHLGPISETIFGWNPRDAGEQDVALRCCVLKPGPKAQVFVEGNGCYGSTYGETTNPSATSTML